jgi:hypothetical protein
MQTDVEGVIDEILAVAYDILQAERVSAPMLVAPLSFSANLIPDCGGVSSRGRLPFVAGFSVLARRRPATHSSCASCFSAARQNTDGTVLRGLDPPRHVLRSVSGRARLLAAAQQGAAALEVSASEACPKIAIAGPLYGGLVDAAAFAPKQSVAVHC